VPVVPFDARSRDSSRTLLVSALEHYLAGRRLDHSTAYRRVGA
jgi:hypothetical protein